MYISASSQRFACVLSFCEGVQESTESSRGIRARLPPSLSPGSAGPGSRPRWKVFHIPTAFSRGDGPAARAGPAALPTRHCRLPLLVCEVLGIRKLKLPLIGKMLRLVTRTNHVFSFESTDVEKKPSQRCAAMKTRPLFPAHPDCVRQISFFALHLPSQHFVTLTQSSPPQPFSCPIYSVMRGSGLR